VKRFIMSALILLMLALMVFPVAINAATTTSSTRTPFDWLNDEEQAYVTSLRAQIAEVQGQVQAARADLGTIILQSRESWYGSLHGEFHAINKGLDAMAALTAPAEFTAIGTQCQDMPDVGLSELDMLSMASTDREALVETAQMVGHIDGDLAAVDGALSSLLGSINSRIANIASRREKAAEMVSDIFSSCMERPARLFK
jgi:hypothetical protein